MYPGNLSAKKGTHKITMLTAYDYSMASILNQTDVDMILVGDSLGNVMLGHKDTIAVTLNDMIHHARAVVKGAPDKVVIVDMPFMSISMGLEKSLESVMNIMQSTGAHGVKIEGGKQHVPLVEALSHAGVPVMGHLGLTPQSYLNLGGYKTQGNTTKSAEQIMSDAKALCDAGVFSIVLECVNEDLSKAITQEISVPTIGIGSGPHTDGQVLVINDMIGLTTSKVPSFVKPRLNLSDLIKKAVSDFNLEVRGN